MVCIHSTIHSFLYLAPVYCESYPTLLLQVGLNLAQGFHISLLYPPSFCSYPGDIVISLQDSTIHWMENNKVSHSWEGNCGKNQHWNKKVLSWSGSNLCWAPPATQSRQKRDQSIGPLGVKAIVDAIVSPVHPET